MDTSCADAAATGYAARQRGARLLNDDGLTTARICGSHQRWGGDIERYAPYIHRRYISQLTSAGNAPRTAPAGPHLRPNRRNRRRRGVPPHSRGAHQRDGIFEPAIRSPTCLGRRGGVQRREERRVVRRSQRIHHGAQLLHIRAVALLTAAHSAPGALSLRSTSWASARRP